MEPEGIQRGSTTHWRTAMVSAAARARLNKARRHP